MPRNQLGSIEVGSKILCLIPGNYGGNVAGTDSEKVSRARDILLLLELEQDLDQIEQPLAEPGAASSGN